ncbi:gtpase slip-gc, partial [Fusarium flagelliforme]
KSALKAERRDAKKVIKEAESQKKKASKAYGNAKKQHAMKVQKNPYESDAHVTTLKAQRDARAKALMGANKHVEQCDIRKTQIAKEMNYIRDWIAHRAIQTRNTRVMKRLRDNFALRQSGLGHSEQPHVDPDYVLPILPVSTRAFWQLENNEPHMIGFPGQMYTGVPAAEQWLHKATLLKRERHLDETLDEYQSLMTMMRLYSATNGQDGNFNFTRCEVEGALADTHAFYTQKLGSKLAEACDAINKLDPLEYKEVAKGRFLHEANRIVQKWNYKYPDNENDIERMHHSAYAANLRRDGSEYKSPGTGVTYTWIENLAAPILKTLSRDWDEKMNKRLPLIRGPMMADYSRLFTEYLDTIQHVINERVPSLGASFASMRSILENSQRATEIRIDAVLSQLAERTAGVTINAVQGLQADWKPTFTAAMDEKGRGCTVRRVAIVQRRINEDILPMCEEMINRLANGISGRQAEVPSQLRDAAAEGPRQVEQQLSVLVNNLVENLATDPAMKPKKDGLQEDVRVIIEAWEEAWIEEGIYKEHILDWDLEIPDTIPEPVFEDATKSDDDATDDDTFDEDDDED